MSKNQASRSEVKNATVEHCVKWQLSCNDLLSISMRHEVWLFDRRDAITTLALDERTIPDVHTRVVVIVLTDRVRSMGGNVWSV
jgi:hypothetical protein